MKRLDFEQMILEMVFEVGYEQLTPATVAYYLRIPIKAAEYSLDELVKDGILELESDEDGRFFYLLPMAEQTPRAIIEQTVFRRAARNLGSHFTAAELRGESPVEEPAPVVHTYEPPREEFAAPPPPQWAEPVPHPMILADLEPERRHPLQIFDEDGQLVRGELPANPAIPMMLSFFWPGLGQIHNGQPGKGLLMFFTSAFLWLLFLGWVVTIYSVIDAGVVSGQRAEDRARGKRALGNDDEQPALA